ncbi:uncharacterized protein PV07_00006 [Cladophialophora immunda]|uniref:Uncharacterized protein n=1 Tax=Cladophialophora immunda TaxID=569365 RepID=A0A0D2CT96_9EURO|nr:uncharacterized protein PV07_00006 [Cladophialophora immunda]KIW33135.1 hypothetical protein PV07_00006 [Cladophialophora immunda]OQU99905.1 hypothetical protein CLAIMM_05477 [Cladophialophora immunda]
MTSAIEENHIFTDAVAFQPQVVQSSVRGLVTPTAITTTAKPLTLDQVHKVIGLYGPILNLHPKETYFNTSIEDFLSHCTLVDKKTKSRVQAPKADHLPQKGDDGQFYLEVTTDGKKGDFSTAKAYIRAFWQSGMPYTDLQFWFFNAYNGPGTLHIDGLMMDSITSSGDINVAPLGEHVGDWEMCMVRVDNSTLKIISIWLSQHAKGQFFTGDQIDRAFKFQGTQPIIFSSRNGHANFSHAGSNPTESKKIGGIPAGFDFFVRNDTATSDFKLDCSKRYELISADWIGLKSPAWVTYPFRWGPEGTSTHLSAGAVADIVRAAAGDELSKFLPVAAGTVLAGEILPHFVKSDINGPTSPSRHGSWMGIYPVY